MVTGYATSNSCHTIIAINIMHSRLGKQLWEIRKDHLSKFPFSDMLPKKYVYLANMIFNTISKGIHCNIKLLEIDEGNDTLLWLLEDTDRRNRKKYKLYTPQSDLYRELHNLFSSKTLVEKVINISVKLPQL